MQSWKPPRNTARLRWTNHIVRKMRFYGLTPSRVLRVVRAPERMEEGIAPGTLAGMSPYGRSRGAGQRGYRGEVWAMWREEALSTELRASPRRRIIITAWRYPGTSPIRGAIPIPAGVVAELEAEGVF